MVDAFNVIGSRGDGWWRDRAGAVRRVVSLIEGWSAGDPSLEVTVVVDGDVPAGLDVGRVRVIGAPGGRNAADRVIQRVVLEDADPGSMTVVTSDRALADAVAAAGARVVGAGRFREDLEDAATGR